MEDSSLSSPRSQRPARRPERQQILLRRGLALGAGLLVLVLLVLGVRGCLDARKNRALSDYSNDVTQIVEETAQTSSSFFGKLAGPEDLSVTDFIDEVNADRSAMDSFRTRVDALDAPGDMSDAQRSLELVYELRAAAMNEIAGQISTALGEVGSAKATRRIANQIKVLLAADVLYASVARPEINSVLAKAGLSGDEVPRSVFVPEGTTWLDEAAVAAALGSVTGKTTTGTSGVHGLGLGGVRINGTELVAEGTVAFTSEEAPQIEVDVMNQGESTETGITVTVTVNGSALTGTIATLAASETETVTIPLTPAPTGTATVEVDVATVPGELVSDNNKASYTVEFP